MSSLHDKLYNYEQTPPEKAWDKIAAALDESHISNEFPSKLYNAEAVPPAGAWDKIVSALEPSQIPAIPIGKSFSFLRYAAAALFIGLVSFGIIKWINSNNDKTDKRMVVAPGTTNRSANKELPAKKNSVDSTAQQENKITDENSNDVATTGQIRTPSAKKARSNYSIASNTDAAEPIYAYNEHTPNLADRYIMLMTPDGGIIRMSKKWGDLVCCVSGQEQDENCKDQLKKWQEKIACSPITTSPGNFMDIRSLVNSLNDTEL